MNKSIPRMVPKSQPATSMLIFAKVFCSIFVMGILVLSSGCREIDFSNKKNTQEYNFTGENLQLVRLAVEYCYVPFKKKDDLEIYVNGYQIDVLSYYEHTKGYYMMLDPGTYTIDVYEWQVE